MTALVAGQPAVVPGPASADVPAAGRAALIGAQAGRRADVLPGPTGNRYPGNGQIKP